MRDQLRRTGRIKNPPIREMVESPEIVLVAPPRTGLEKRALDGILKLSLSLFAYVSCDPSALALDARRLINGGYTLKDVRPFDLFPQTYHLESISFFEQ